MNYIEIKSFNTSSLKDIKYISIEVQYLNKTNGSIVYEQSDHIIGGRLNTKMIINNLWCTHFGSNDHLFLFLFNFYT